MATADCHPVADHLTDIDKITRFSHHDSSSLRPDGLVLPVTNFFLALEKVFSREPYWHRLATPLLASADDVMQQVGGEGGGGWYQFTQTRT